MVNIELTRHGMFFLELHSPQKRVSCAQALLSFIKDSCFFFLPQEGDRVMLKVACQILGRKFYKNTKKIILILPKPLNFHS